MKKLSLLMSALLVCGLIIYDAPDTYVHGSWDGAPSGRTGSPGDNSTCFNGCHGSNPGNGMANEALSITHNVPVTGYGPGNTYDVTVTMTSAGTNSFGFSLSPQNAGGAVLGTLIAGAGTQLNGGGGYVTQTENSGAGSKSWTFQWTAPTAGTGSVTFYCASIFGNSSFSNAGDFMVTGTETVQEGTTVGIFDQEAASVSIYPNPAVDVIRLNAELESQTAFEIIDLKGAIVQVGLINAGTNPAITLDRAIVNSGMHLLRLSSAEGSTTTRIVVQ